MPLKSLLFPIPRDVGDSHGPLPASLSQRPTPHSTLIENKGATSIRKDCQKVVDALSLFFPARIRTQFQPIFLVSAVRSAEGRKPFHLAYSNRP